jgi:hypothetical protein
MALQGMLWRSRCLGVRFSAPLEGPGKLSYQIVCDDRAYALEKLSANTRSKVRRGLRRCTVRPLAMTDIAAQGRVPDRDTLERQGRSWRWSGDEGWARYWRAAAATPGMEGWGRLHRRDAGGLSRHGSLRRLRRVPAGALPQ